MSQPGCFPRGNPANGPVIEVEPRVTATRLRAMQPDLSDPKALRAVLERHDVRAAKGIGQHFLVDRSVLAAIVDAAELTENDDVLEIGPGPGVLTAALAARARSVTAVEIDRRMVHLLEETLGERRNVRVVHADALAVDLYALAPRAPTRIVANIPYQITTPLLE